MAPPTILIVDDDRYTRNVLEALFTRDKGFVRAGVRIVTADDGDEGLEAYRKHKPRVVIADLLMPKKDGFALCRAIREEPRGSKVELFVSSGVYRDATISKRLRADYDAVFFAKPYQVRELASEVARRLGIQSAPPRARPAKPAAGPRKQGRIADRRVPALLYDLLDERVTGRLALKRGHIDKTVVVVLGHPVNATTNVREETLGHFLISCGVIDEAQHKRALASAATRSIRMGQALIDEGVLSSEQLVELLSAQTRHKIVQTLRWPDGTWAFTPTPDPTVGGEPLDVDRLVLRGLKQTADRREALERAERLRHTRLHLSERGQALASRLPHFLGSEFAARFVDGSTFAELLAAGAEREDAALSIDALLEAGALRTGERVVSVEGRPAPSSPQQLELPEAPDVPSVTSLSVLTQTQTRAPAQTQPPVSAQTRPPVPSQRQSPAPAQTQRQSPAPAQTQPQPPEPAQTQRPAPAPAAPSPWNEDDDDLAGLLFGDLGDATRTGARPLAATAAAPETLAAGSQDSGLIDISDILTQFHEPADARSEGERARRMLLEEFLRVQGLDYYDLLEVTSEASREQISAALLERCEKFSPEWFSRFDLGRDYAKLEEIHRYYELARTTLLDADARAAYDRALLGDEAGPPRPSMAAELAFGAATEQLTQGDFDGAIAKLEQAVRVAPTEPGYHAELGWAHFVRGDRRPEAADAARPHLNHALRLDPDHGRAHEYKGVITATLGTDDVEAIFHIERALDATPTRLEPLDSLEQARRRRGELRPLERQYRALLHRCVNAPEQTQLELWRRLARVYTDLDELDSARVAYESALRLAPDDAALRDALMDLRGGAADGFHERSRALREAWRAEPQSPAPGIEMFDAAQQARRWDSAFLAASALVARGLADDRTGEYYRRYRPRFVIRAQRPLDGELWAMLRHRDDAADTGALFDLLAPLYARLAPLDPSELEIDDRNRVPDEQLPDAFIRLRAYLAHVLGVPVPAVHVRPDFGHQIHVGAVQPAVLLVGEDALRGPEHLELAHRLGRAMTYLQPGRALGGSRPARMLKSGMLAALKSALPATQVDDPSGFLHAFAAAIDELDDHSRGTLHAIVVAAARKQRAINLSAWQRALGRTADRAALLITGDLPAVVRFARETGGGGALDELIDFAVSSEHISLRSAMGLSVERLTRGSSSARPCAEGRVEASDGT